LRAVWWNSRPRLKISLHPLRGPLCSRPRRQTSTASLQECLRENGDSASFALHAVASPALRRRCARSIGDDQRNRSSEPIAYEDEEALDRLSGIADAFLIGERPIARRVDDSVARDGVFGPVIIRRARGYAPGAVASLPTARPILAVGADLKNSITLVVDGQSFMSQHIGDLAHYESLRAFQDTIQDLISMYESGQRNCSWCMIRIRSISRRLTP